MKFAWVWLLWVAGAAAQGVARDVTFPCDGLNVPGTLTVPAKAGPATGWPLVVLVQGSGPSDRDETVGPNKIFRDLAEGLAQRGVATLRYDKRTYLMAHGKVPMPTRITLGAEVVDDAVAALAFGAAQPGVDAKRVFLLGHSLGGSLAPRIAAERLRQAAGSVRGLIEMSGAALPVSLILPEQVAFQAALHGQDRDHQVKAAGTYVETFRLALNPATDAASSTMLGVPTAYLREWNEVDTAKELKAVGLPALVLHGQKDVQVLYPDFVLLSVAATAAGSKSLEFAGLNHLFLPVVGESTGAEYLAAGRVPGVVMDVIAGWLP